MQVDLIRAGTTYSLSDGTYCWFYGVDGAGMSPLHRLRERGPLQHGETDVGFRLDPRLITLLLAMPAQTYSAYWTARANLLSILLSTSESDDITLRFTLDNGSVRSLDCHYVAGGGLATSEEAKSRLQKIPLVFNAGDPTFYDPTINTEIWTLAISSDLIVGHPVTLLTKFTIPFILGSGTISASTSVIYTGTWFSYPVITLTGPMNWPIVENQTTDEFLRYQAGIAAGQTVTIDTSFAAKTVKDNTGANLISNLSDDSDLATFHIRNNATNVINVSATGLVAGQSNISMQYYTRYVGI